MNLDVSKWNVLGDYKLLRELGVAKMSRYVLAVHEVHQTAHTIRVMSKSLLSQSKEIRDLFYDELTVLRRRSHPSITPLTEILEDDRCIYVATKYITGPPLSGKFSVDAALLQSSHSESRARTLFHQIVNIALFLERHEMSHWFKLENIIQSTEDKLILLDFRSPEDDLMNFDPRNRLPVEAIHYKAPELLNTDAHSAAGNAWACGIALYLLVTGALPFNTSDTEGNLNEKVRLGRLNALPNWVSTTARDLIWVLLKRHPSKRLAMRDIPEHPWFTEGILDHDEKSILVDLASGKLSSLIGKATSRAETTQGGRHSLRLPRAVTDRTMSDQLNLSSLPTFSMSQSHRSYTPGYKGGRHRPKSVTFEEPLPSALHSKRLMHHGASMRADWRATADAEHMRIAQQIVKEEAEMSSESKRSFSPSHSRNRAQALFSLPNRKRTRREQMNPESPPRRTRRRWTLQLRSPITIRRFE